MHFQADCHYSGIGRMDIKPVNDVHFIEIVEGAESHGPTCTLIMTGAQLELLRARLDIYLRSLDPPEAPSLARIDRKAVDPRNGTSRIGDPLPERDPTAPLEAAPNVTSNGDTVLVIDKEEDCKCSECVANMYQ